ncbi:MAG TPA: thiamine-phosphate kinase [Acidobacteriaceae bacterium]|nr:thiamine-phosphate kinase [Acidobacteriaceae bacterium]
MARASTKRTIAGELALVEAIRRRALRGRSGAGAVRLGIGDDCAVLRAKVGREICVTTDFSLEGVHFRRDWHAPQSAGHRCLARGLSDLAAMGAEPMAVFLSLALPAGTKQAWVDGFLDGLLALADRHGVALAGGDTAQSPGGIAADILAVGQVARGGARLRSGARAGDRLYVTGALGGAAAELLAVERSPERFRRIAQAEPGHPHLFPEPRLAVGKRLSGLASAMIDVSDGLSTDLTHLCEASGLAAEIDGAALPVHPLAMEAERRGFAGSAEDLALHGGEDYELLFTARPGVRIPRRIEGVAVTQIGTLRRGRRGQVVLRKRGQAPQTLRGGGWEHFGK